ncbi:putative rRNA 2'-O-methyltransferase fibrillarin 3 isoform X1 [Arabidopsis lyrata subsp. lyrata]|uniref:putative rRNA 2'-O-methyltransferase fibrillarin 3 isoform X1 n=1 Tax=Arabidopsis lyrata subsp. lyrata TaxID=81972 RepID=UPI000A29D7AD|nr:putative rRNA 2'-O-methyltransferase fibrillarin 3 isoform X1 [Arabidopsis lyrata subsp. lyrata]|eukprot:XP_020871124.1 putative rRNA 2'-O-methyltransferase fibrillarin 3 isoform X1 [Arabidopsis lyrata subsp. lyrata]
MYIIMPSGRGGGGSGRGLARGGEGGAIRGRGRGRESGPGRVKSRESESGGIKGGSKVLVTPHRHAGVFVAKSKADALVTKNLVPGEIIYNEKRIFVQNEDRSTVEYRVWNPHRSKLADAITTGVDNIWIKPGVNVLYLGASSGYTVSHISDIVGPEGCVYAVEHSHICGKVLMNMAEKRTNVIPIIEDARHPAKYRMLVGMVDVIFSDVNQPDQSKILGLNASYFLKSGGHFMISIKANSIDSTIAAETVYQMEVEKLQMEELRPTEILHIDSCEEKHACVFGGYRLPRKQKADTAV